MNPAIAMASNGNFVITWQSFGQANATNYAIYARMYNANGTDYVNTAGTDLGEFRINNSTATNADPAGRRHGRQRGLRRRLGRRDGHGATATWAIYDRLVSLSSSSTTTTPTAGR